MTTASFIVEIQSKTIYITSNCVGSSFFHDHVSLDERYTYGFSQDTRDIIVQSYPEWKIVRFVRDPIARINSWYTRNMWEIPSWRHFDINDMTPGSPEWFKSFSVHMHYDSHTMPQCKIGRIICDIFHYKEDIDFHYDYLENHFKSVEYKWLHNMSTIFGIPSPYGHHELCKFVKLYKEQLREIYHMDYEWFEGLTIT